MPHYSAKHYYFSRGKLYYTRKPKDVEAATVILFNYFVVLNLSINFVPEMTLNARCSKHTGRGSVVLISHHFLLQVKLGMKPVTVDEFFEVNLVQNLAALLGIDTSRIRIMNVVGAGGEQGRRRRETDENMVVEFEIGDPPAATIEHEEGDVFDNSTVTNSTVDGVGTQNYTGKYGIGGTVLSVHYSSPFDRKVTQCSANGATRSDRFEYVTFYIFSCYVLR